MRAGFAALDAQAQERVRALLPHHDAAILWEGEVAASGFNEDNHLPFGKAINVYGQGIPP
ncbi:hypothetical protein [Altererythrobacter litoralis]|uniref:Uncharacterized protein n=1 Tax=Altererythrobacter litoralis TaxID=3113904 RepID=A0ABU7GBT4_9SPHN|nr:hypothetical protein [Erythrobacteraceae bacterium 1XM1-14]